MRQTRLGRMEVSNSPRSLADSVFGSVTAVFATEDLWVAMEHPANSSGVFFPDGECRQRDTLRDTAPVARVTAGTRHSAARMQTDKLREMGAVGDCMQSRMLRRQERLSAVRTATRL